MIRYRRGITRRVEMSGNFRESMIGRVMRVSWSHKKPEYTTFHHHVGIVIDKNTMQPYHECKRLCDKHIKIPDYTIFSDPDEHSILYYLTEEVPDPYTERKDVIEYSNWIEYVLPKCITIADITALKPGERIKMLIMDRNLGDTVCEVNKSDTIYSLQEFFKDKMIVYEHVGGLVGNTVWDYELAKEDISDISKLDMTQQGFEFDINYRSVNWYPLTNGRLPEVDEQGFADFGDTAGKHYSEFPSTTLIGCRGPMMLWDRLSELDIQQIYWHSKFISREEARTRYIRSVIGQVMNIEWKKYNTEGKLTNIRSITGKIVDENHFVAAQTLNKFDTTLHKIPKNAKITHLMMNMSKRLYLRDPIPDPNLNGIKHSEWRAYVKNKCLTIADVTALKPGDRLRVITMDRNEWEVSEAQNKSDVLHSVQDFFRRKVSVYIHNHDLMGDIAWDFENENKDLDDYYSFTPSREFEFDINYRGINWYPLTDGRLPDADPQGFANFGELAGKHYSEFPPDTLIGWRGPMMLWERLSELDVQQIYWHDKFIPLTEEEKREDAEIIKHLRAFNSGGDAEEDEESDEESKEEKEEDVVMIVDKIDNNSDDLYPGVFVKFN